MVSVKAINANTTSHFVNQTITLLLNTPTNITLTPADRSISLQWNPVDKANSYRVSLEINGKYTNETIDRAFHIFNELEPGSKYSMSIQAINIIDYGFQIIIIIQVKKFKIF